MCVGELDWFGIYLGRRRSLVVVVAAAVNGPSLHPVKRAKSGSREPLWPITASHFTLLLVGLLQRQPSRLALFLFNRHLFCMFLDFSVNRVLFAQHRLWCAVADFPLPLVELHHLLLLELSQKLASSILACPAEALDLVALVRMCFQLAA